MSNPSALRCTAVLKIEDLIKMQEYLQTLLLDPSADPAGDSGTTSVPFHETQQSAKDGHHGKPNQQTHIPQQRSCSKMSSGLRLPSTDTEQATAVCV